MWVGAWDVFIDTAQIKKKENSTHYNGTTLFFKKEPWTKYVNKN